MVNVKRLIVRKVGDGFILSDDGSSWIVRG